MSSEINSSYVKPCAILEGTARFLKKTQVSVLLIRKSFDGKTVNSRINCFVYFINFASPTAS